LRAENAQLKARIAELEGKALMVYPSIDHQIVESGMQENPVSHASGTGIKRGCKRPSKAKNLLDCCQKHEKDSLSFMYDFPILLSNILAERDIRMMKLPK